MYETALLVASQSSVGAAYAVRRSASGRSWPDSKKSLHKPVAAVCDRRRGVENQSKHGSHRPPLQQKRLSQRFL